MRNWIYVKDNADAIIDITFNGKLMKLTILVRMKIIQTSRL